MYYTTNEYKFWRLLRDKLRKDFHLSRIESVVSVGIPDVFFATRGGRVNGWIELKVAHGKQVRFGKEQFAWIKQHAKEGVNIHILALKNGPQSGPNPKTIYHWEGSQIADIKSKGIESGAKHTWPAPFDWPEIIGTISGESSAP